MKSFRERPLAGRYRYVWLDALEAKCREEGRIVNVACLVGVGVMLSRFKDAARMVAEAEEILSFTAFPKEH